MGDREQLRRDRRGFSRAAFAGLTLALTWAVSVVCANDVSRYNVTWASPSRDHHDSMPLGNGATGLNAWIEPSGDLCSYIGRTDSWSDNARLLKAGKVRVHLEPAPSVEPFEQTHSLADATMLVRYGEGEGAATLRLWVDANHPVIHVPLDTAKPATAAHDERQANPAAVTGAGQATSNRRILIITGEDYKGHLWQKTTPVLKAQLEKDKRLRVDVLENLDKLAATDLRGYAAVVMHFKNYNPKVPGRAGFDKLATFVEGGGGLVLVHFACGAFEEFKDDFAKLAGRVWNPKLRGHDPHGKFRVEISKQDHPITRGMTAFETTDELYTCLDGSAKINVLATAVSKVDGKVYPMAFVLDHGKGRVFHCVLGHDAAALANDGAGALYRRGTAWAARLDQPEPADRKRSSGASSTGDVPAP